MSICAANLSIYSNMFASLFRNIIFSDSTIKDKSLAAKIINADAFGEIAAHKSAWMQFAREINQVWITIKTAENDEQAIDAWINLYHQCARDNTEDFILDEIEGALFCSVLSLQLSEAARNKADSFLQQCQQAFNQKNIVIPGWVYEVSEEHIVDDETPRMRRIP
jgi:hypothetical protein